MEKTAARKTQLRANQKIYQASTLGKLQTKEKLRRLHLRRKWYREMYEVWLAERHLKVAEFKPAKYVDSLGRPISGRSSYLDKYGDTQHARLIGDLVNRECTRGGVPRLRDWARRPGDKPGQLPAWSEYLAAHPMERTASNATDCFLRLEKKKLKEVAQLRAAMERITSVLDPETMAKIAKILSE